MLGSKTTLAVVRELFWGILGRGGLKGIGVSGSGYNEVLAMGMLNVVDYVERGRCAKLPESDDDDCFYYHSWRNNVVIAFGTLSSFLS